MYKAHVGLIQIHTHIYIYSIHIVIIKTFNNEELRYVVDCLYKYRDFTKDEMV